MKRDWMTRVLLLLIAMALLAIAGRLYMTPRPAQAASGSSYPFYIEPGTQMLRAPDASKQLLGRVVVDMRTGKVWGFPTYGSDAYPTDPMSNKPAVSRPFELGRFAFEDTDK